MKGQLVKNIKRDFNIRSINGKKLELYDFYSLCGFYKKLKAGSSIK